jgi:hypothetical protein
VDLLAAAGDLQVSALDLLAVAGDPLVVEDLLLGPLIAGVHPVIAVDPAAHQADPLEFLVEPMGLLASQAVPAGRLDSLVASSGLLASPVAPVGLLVF